MKKLFGYNLYLQDRATLIQELKHNIALGQTSTVISLNTLKLYQGSRSKYLASLFQSGTHIIPDGQSIALAEYLVHGNRISAISGAELMVELIKESARCGYKIFFLGSPRELLDRVSAKIEKDYPQLKDKVAFQDGYYDVAHEGEVVSKIADFEPDFLFVAFGSPRKEEFIIKYHSRLNAKVIMGVGGSYEYFVGDVKLDPLTKKLGLRWLVRTLQDPARLAKRYAVCNSYFLYALIREMLYSRRRSAY
ncbi:WecB/TagA/CpsF family glycosyltransferase [Pontibacter chinhatensis]|uniref:N-acetylmannosaminyltransferase n=1 Tax=Pontibacter chinhatensis TaxID=1436961 RepID=A0A1I2MZJ6_9BACT|nr:WecB/TagA/CpsF family glycosyltransferase [Pontibacter chinhatensis]SFF96932.1 N-acetylmannosaminyltransferase [Pontibacter chinhatensis]